jgi:putative oxidoreductase
MLFAFVLVHMTQLAQLTPEGGWMLELQGFFLFCGLALMFLGSGRIAVRPD